MLTGIMVLRSCRKVQNPLGTFRDEDCWVGFGLNDRLNPVFKEVIVACDDRKIHFERRSDDEAICGIAVMKWKQCGIHHHFMGHANNRKGKLPFYALKPNDRIKSEFQLTNLTLESDFPKCHRRDVSDFAFGDLTANVGRDAVGGGRQPKQGTGIDQERFSHGKRPTYPSRQRKDRHH